MENLVFRTEELSSEQIRKYYVESNNDRNIVERLKSTTPVILIGSRGVGKSFLFKIAEDELLKSFDKDSILPIFLTFRRASLLQSKNPLQFQSWMLARMCSEIIRALNKQGKLIGITRSLKILTGEDLPKDSQVSYIEKIAQQFEDSWKNPGIFVDEKGLPSLDNFLNAVEDLCEELTIKRVIFFIDEAAHVFYPEQQRQFFTLFRDLHSQYIKCNAAVYPGVTVYGDTFEPMHDALTIQLNRSIEDESYIKHMKEIVLKQLTESKTITSLSKYGQNFSLLAYAAGGNPRHLLKTVALAEKMDSASINKVFREYYRSDIWAEHSNLAEKYPGYKDLIDWGREFVESTVLPELKSKNDQYISKNKPATAYFWIHRNAPQVVKEALRILEYTGVIYEHSMGIRATREGIGTRYTVNLGCLLSLEATPSSTGNEIVRQLTIKRMSEYGANHKTYEKLVDQLPTFSETSSSEIFQEQIKKNVANLDLTEWQLEKLKELSINTIGELLDTPESRLMEAHYVATVRARTIKNAAFAAVYEYLLG